MLLLGATLLGCARPVAPPAPPPPPAPPGSAPAAEAPPPPCSVVERVVVSKAERRLVAHCEGGGRFETTVALGRGGRGPKRVAGDMRTPEGRYHVVAPARPSRFHLFVPLDYPSLADADRALADGTISPADHARILDAAASGDPPPSDTPLGGDFGLHGEGPDWHAASRQLDWTLGCLAVDDATIDFLAGRLPVGTPFDIQP